MATKSKLAPKYRPLYSAKEGIGKHWKLLLAEVRKVLPADGLEYSFEASLFEGISGNLSCAGFRHHKVLRERGGFTPIVPLVDEDHLNPSYWLSLYQSWRPNPNPRREQLLYNTTSITVYFGNPESDEKLQLFRAEWPGIKVQFMESNEEFIFEAPGAGHPHWQFDAYQTRAREVEAERQRLIDVSKTLNDTLPDVEDFGDVAVAELSSDVEEKRLLCMNQLTRMHFASHAEWATSRWYGDESDTESHARGPENTSQIVSWTLSSLLYIQRELLR